MPQFTRYIGVDYSGAETPEARLTGLRVYLADGDAEPHEVEPHNKYFARREIAEWLVGRLAEHVPTIVGIDHGFSFPLAYFERHGLAHDWPAFLDDFQAHWPTDSRSMYVDFIREGVDGDGASRMGNSRWRRLAEIRTRRAKSVFHFDVPGSVAKSTHAGLPWLRYIRQTLGDRVHFWPFDGLEVPAGRSVMAETYPALVSGLFPRESRTADQHDAYSLAAWLSRADRSGELAGFLFPRLSEAERAIASIEGWILGVGDRGVLAGLVDPTVSRHINAWPSAGR